MATASVQRRARAKENLRRAILDAARDLFGSEGFEAVSMRRIADKIEYSPTAIYLHFQDKHEILFHLIEEGFAMLIARLETTRKLVPDPVERLRQGARVYFGFAFEQSHYYRLMFQLQDKVLVEKFMPECQIGQQAFGFIVAAVSEAQANGTFRKEVDPLIISHTLWAAMHGAVSLALSGHLSKMPEQYHPFFFDQIIESGIRGWLV